MAANKSKEVKDGFFDEIINEISEAGKSLKTALKGRMTAKTFYKYIEEDNSRINIYARACECRADIIAEEILQIADGIENDVIVTEDGREIVNHNVINRDRLRVDARKWVISKLHPKKYGDKVVNELTGSDGSPLVPLKGITFNRVDPA